LEVELGGKRAREVIEPELISFFLEGVFAGVGKARSADEREDWCAEVRGCEGSESNGETREEED
jgi:hypothetical protein